VTGRDESKEFIQNVLDWALALDMNCPSAAKKKMKGEKQ